MYANNNIVYFVLLMSRNDVKVVFVWTSKLVVLQMELNEHVLYNTIHDLISDMPDLINVTKKL